MNSLGLSAAALAERRKYVQAGDAQRIMLGQWREVWLEKMGDAHGDDLTDVLRVQMGLFTEPFNLAWCEKQTGRRIEYYSGSHAMQHSWLELTSRLANGHELQVSKTYPFMACNLDGMTTTAAGHRCVIDAKHVGQAGDPMILNYTAAGVHQATVMGTDWWALSVFIGNGKWELIEQEVDPLYQASLIAAEREFWGYVERGEEPQDRGDAILPPKPQKVLRTIDLSADYGTPEFGELAKRYNWAEPVCRKIAVFASTQAAATLNAITREEIKGLVPDDVGELTRGLYSYKRNKAGAITMTLKKEPADAP